MRDAENSSKRRQEKAARVRLFRRAGREGRAGGIGGLTFNAAAGGAILFDYRILHRGLGNGSPADRPMLYFTYGRQWFRDSTNYPALSLFD